jgi:hypothetical protein
MLDAILLLLGLGSCAFILIAFWGTNLLGNEWHRRARPPPYALSQRAAYQRRKGASLKTARWPRTLTESRNP